MTQPGLRRRYLTVGELKTDNLNVSVQANLEGNMAILGDLNVAQNMKIGGLYLRHDAVNNKIIISQEKTVEKPVVGEFEEVNIRLKSSSTGETTMLTFYRERDVGVDGIGSNIRFYCTNSEGNETYQGRMYFIWKNSTAGSETAIFNIGAMIDGVMTDVATFNGSKWQFYGGIDQTLVEYLVVADKKIVLNSGGGAGSGGNCGIYVEEDQVETAYIKVSQDRKNIELKAPLGNNCIVNQSLGVNDDVVFNSVKAKLSTYLDMFVGKIATGNSIEDTCEAIGTWTSSGANFTVALDNANYKVGAGSLKFTTNSSVLAGDKCYKTKTPAVDLSSSTNVGFWVKGTINGYVDFYIHDTTGGDQVISMGSGNYDDWTYITLDISSLTRAAVDKIGFNITTNGAGQVFTFNIDQMVLFSSTNSITLTNKPIFNGLRGVWYIPLALTSNHNVSALTENTNFVLIYDTNKKFVPLEDLSGATIFFNYCYE